MGHSIKRTVWLVGRLLLVALAADLLRPVVAHAIPPVVESFLSLSDVTTANSSTSKHGFLKKLDNTATHYMDGTGAWSTPSGGSGGALVGPLESHTASASSSLDFTSFISSSYTIYIFEVDHLVPSTSGVNINVVVGTGAGPTWDTGAHYDWNTVATDSAGGSAAPAAAGGVAIRINSATISNTSTDGISGGSKMYLGTNGTTHPFFTGISDLWNGSVMNQNSGGGRYTQTTAVTGVRFIPSAGNWASGSIYVYALSH